MVKDDAEWSAPAELADIQRGPVPATAAEDNSRNAPYNAQSEGIPGGLARSSQTGGERSAKIGAKNDPLLTTGTTSRFALKFAQQIAVWVTAAFTRAVIPRNPERERCLVIHAKASLG